MKKLISLITMLGFALFLNGCVAVHFESASGVTPVEASGVTVEEVRVTQSWNRLELSMEEGGHSNTNLSEHWLTVNIFPFDRETEVIADAAHLDLIDVSVIGGVLSIDIDPAVSHRNPVIINVGTDYLNAITTLGNARFVSMGLLTTDELTIRSRGLETFILELDTQRLELIMEGLGSTTVTGTAGVLDVTLNGLGNIDLEGLTTKEATVHANGLGNITLTATEQLRVNLNGMGSVTYFGSPTDVEINRRGLGSVTQG